MSKVTSLAKTRSRKEPEDLNASQALSPFEVERSPEKELVFFDSDGRGGAAHRKVEAPENLELPLSVYSPNASGGDYKKAFLALGVRDVIAFDTTSSAGDWVFLVKRGGEWYCASQEMCMDGGFTYGIGENNIFWDASEFGLGDDMIEAVRERDPDYVAAEESARDD